MNKYDIYWAIVPFEEGKGEKRRPILIFNETVFLISAFPITSKGKSIEYQCEIAEWKKSGLTMPSYIKLKPIRFTDKSMIKEKIGELQLSDIYRLENCFYNR